jgi:uncharacterized membrane protein (GlpM family)
MVLPDGEDVQPELVGQDCLLQKLDHALLRADAGGEVSEGGQSELHAEQHSSLVADTTTDRGARGEVVRRQERVRRGQQPEVESRPGSGGDKEAEAVHDVLVLAIKGLAGGALVCVFALLSQSLAPKRFAGLFSAAPAVALAGLAVVLVDKGAHTAHEQTLGMVAGGAGMIAYAAAVVPLLRRFGATVASATGLVAWVGVAAVGLLPILLP